MKNLRWALLFAALVMCICAVTAETNYPKLTQRVNDFTNTLSYQEWQEIDRELKSYEDTASTQIVVLMVNSLDGINIDDYASKTFELNQIGRAQNNNGILFIVVKQNQKIKIEAGNGLKGVIKDAVSSQIISKEIQPYFNANNYFGGIVTGANAIIRAKEGAYQINSNAFGVVPIVGIIALIAGIICLIFFWKKIKGWFKK